MKFSLLLLSSAAALLCSCSHSFLTCNLHELVAPPDARVAMVDNMYPHRPLKDVNTFILSADSALSTEPYFYKLNGIYYQKRTIQYAEANRPIIRREDKPWGNAPLTFAETKEQFTIDPTIQEEVWMQPVCISRDEPADRKLICIPAEQFDFAKAIKVKKTRGAWTLCSLPIENKPGTESAWRIIVGTPLALIDIAANCTFFVAESSLFLSAGLISLPFQPIINAYQQQNQQIPESKPE